MAYSFLFPSTAFLQTQKRNDYFPCEYGDFYGLVPCPYRGFVPDPVLLHIVRNTQVPVVAAVSQANLSTCTCVVEFKITESFGSELTLTL